MIIARAPLRITLGGGGTDSPEYLKDHGGFAITAAIDKYVFVAVNESFTNDYYLRYSETERASTIPQIRHPIIREALAFHGVWPGVEVVSTADIPSGTGLGSSGAFGVALVLALSQRCGSRIDQRSAAIAASTVELERLGRPGGRQDHWASAFGDVRTLKFDTSGVVYGALLDAPVSAMEKLESCLHLYYTGTRRDADDVLGTQTVDGLDEIKHLGYQVHHRIVSGDIAGLGQLMNEHWFLKRQRSREMTNTSIDLAYATALDNGAIGGKLVGAGGGGFMLFVTEDDEKLTSAMGSIGMRHVPFTFDRTGATIISR